MLLFCKSQFFMLRRQRGGIITGHFVHVKVGLVCQGTQASKHQSNNNNNKKNIKNINHVLIKFRLKRTLWTFILDWNATLSFVTN